MNALLYPVTPGSFTQGRMSRMAWTGQEKSTYLASMAPAGVGPSASAVLHSFRTGRSPPRAMWKLLRDRLLLATTHQIKTAPRPAARYHAPSENWARHARAPFIKSCADGRPAHYAGTLRLRMASAGHRRGGRPSIDPAAGKTTDTLE